MNLIFVYLACGAADAWHSDTAWAYTGPKKHIVVDTFFRTERWTFQARLCYPHIDIPVFRRDTVKMVLVAADSESRPLLDGREQDGSARRLVSALSTQISPESHQHTPEEERAAITVQRYYRGYRVRKQMKHMRLYVSLPVVRTSILIGGEGGQS